MTDSVSLQVTISGMGGGVKSRPETILGELDLSTGTLLVHGSRQEDPGAPVKRDEDAAVMTNDPSTADYDALFREEDFREAIAAYFAMNASGRLVIDADQARHGPYSKIEPDGVDEKGRKYRVAADIDNGQVAVIAMCMLAQRQGSVSNQIDAFDDMPDLEVMTVGLPMAYQGGRAHQAEAYGNWSYLSDL